MEVRFRDREVGAVNEYKHVRVRTMLIGAQEGTCNSPGLQIAAVLLFLESKIALRVFYDIQ